MSLVDMCSSLASSLTQPLALQAACHKHEALAQVVVPQCEAAACNLRTRCRLTNLNTPFESILRGDSSFGIRSRSFARAVSVFSIRCNNNKQIKSAEQRGACRKVDRCATEACARSARLAAQMEAALCPRPLPSPMPALASLGALLSHVLGSPWPACSERRLGCERGARSECSESQQPAGDLRARGGGLSRRSAL